MSINIPNLPKIDRSDYPERALAVFNMAFERGLNNLAGCNMTFRADDDHVYITRSGATNARLGKLTKDDLILADYSGNIVEGEGPLSVEYLCHTTILKQFPHVEIVFHTHSFYAMMLSARGESIPPLLEPMHMYGDTVLVPDTHRFSTQGFVNDIMSIMHNHPALENHGGCGLLYPRHGVLVVNTSPERALDHAERVEWNARAVTYDRLLGPSNAGPVPSHVVRAEHHGGGH